MVPTEQKRTMSTLHALNDVMAALLNARFGITTSWCNQNQFEDEIYTHFAQKAILTPVQEKCGWILKLFLLNAFCSQFKKTGKKHQFASKIVIRLFLYYFVPISCACEHLVTCSLKNWVWRCDRTSASHIHSIFLDYFSAIFVYWKLNWKRNI